jgi:hypothetical protein
MPGGQTTPKACRSLDDPAAAMTRWLAVAGRGVQRPSSITNLDKVIVIMTDGENTQNRWTSPASSIDARADG